MHANPMARGRSPFTAVLGAWAVFCFLVMEIGGGASWHFFVEASDRFGNLHDSVGGGLHVYAAAPYLQFGPLAIVAAWLFVATVGGHAGLFGAQVTGAVLGIVALSQIRALARSVRPKHDHHRVDRQLLLAAAFLLPAWMYLAVGVTHLDDVLALLLSVLALRAAVSGQAVLAGGLLGLAVDAKPWAAGFAALLLLLASRRRITVAVLTAAAVIALAWLPFFLADPATIKALHYTIPNSAPSGLRGLGFTEPRTPGWDRPVQVACGIVLGVVAYLRRRPAALLLVAVNARLALDPGAHVYYQAGLVLAAAVWDVAGSERRMPWWTMGSCLVLFLGRGLPLPAPVFGWLTVACFVASCALLLLPQSRTLSAGRQLAVPAQVGEDWPPLAANR
jgi:hypothetical protein